MTWGSADEFYWTRPNGLPSGRTCLALPIPCSPDIQKWKWTSKTPKMKPSPMRFRRFEDRLTGCEEVTLPARCEHCIFWRDTVFGWETSSGWGVWHGDCLRHGHEGLSLHFACDNAKLNRCLICRKLLSPYWKTCACCDKRVCPGGCGDLLGDRAGIAAWVATMCMGLVKKPVVEITNKEFPPWFRRDRSR